MVQAYLIFGGRCEEALGFYNKALGAKTEMLMRFKECPDPNECPADWEDKVMHASIRIGESTVMASDGCWNERKMEFRGFSLCLNVSEADADKIFSALGDGGQVIMPMESTFFAKRFGMVSDRFGVSWMVIVPAEMPAETKQKLEPSMA